MKKKAELLITQAWQKQSPWLGLFAPLSKAYHWANHYHKQRYQDKQYHAPVPVWVIGNITVGGSGKTPLLIALLHYLSDKGVQVGVISRGYGRKMGGRKIEPSLVKANSTPWEVGDEPCLIAQSVPKVMMAVGADRGQAIELLLATYPDIGLIISDDGLQHYALHRDIEWAVVDVARGFGNQKLLPQGFLREPISRLDSLQVVYHYPNAEATQHSHHAMTMYLSAQPLKPLLEPCLSKPSTPPSSGSSVYALTGIGYPQRFFDSLSRQGLIVKPCPKPDHHAFTLADIIALQDLPIITTAKDAVKLRHLVCDDNRALFERLWVLPVQTVLSDGVYEQVDSLLERWVEL